MFFLRIAHKYKATVIVSKNIQTVKFTKIKIVIIIIKTKTTIIK